MRQPLPLLLGRLQLPSGPRVSGRSDSGARERGARALQPRRPGVHRAVRSSRRSIGSSRASRTWAIRSALHRCGSTTSPRPSSGGCAQSGEKTLTIAPETGSDRLRRVINKTVTNDEILDRAELIFANGIENLKLYYMIGLPTETDEDLVAIRDLTLQMREIMLKHAKAKGQVGRIIASVNPLIPKPSTAYQWLPMEDPSVIDRKIQRLRELTADIDNVFFNIKSERHSFYQALLSLGDRRVAPAIEAAEANGGDWRKAVADAGVDADFYVFREKAAGRSASVEHHRRRHEGVVLPQRARQELSRGMDAAAQARRRKRAAASPS